MKQVDTFIYLQCLSLSVEAQQPKKIYRIGYLDSSSFAGTAPLLKAFESRLSELGWVDEKNVIFQYRFAKGEGRARVRELAAELVKLKVDVIVTRGTNAGLAAKHTTSAIPIVMASGGDPVEAGLVASLARPGGNITGMNSLSPELIGKRLELLKDVVPKLARVGVLTRSVAV